MYPETLKNDNCNCGINSRYNDFALQLAEAQFTGFIDKSKGSSLIDLLISMGLAKEEWQILRFYNLFEYNQTFRDEIDNYFNM